MSTTATNPLGSLDNDLEAEAEPTA
eukprot:COSAG04_NODE_15029_length_546_cov_1.062640_1_plen_24_part_01